LRLSLAECFRRGLDGAALLKKKKNKILSRTPRSTRGLPEKRFQRDSKRPIASPIGKKQFSREKLTNTKPESLIQPAPREKWRLVLGRTLVMPVMPRRTAAMVMVAVVRGRLI
jgi:hypothetical protein